MDLALNLLLFCDRPHVFICANLFGLINGSTDNYFNRG